MIKFSLVDISSIEALIPKSMFSDENIEKLADMILDSGGILNVILLAPIGINRYKILAGHLFYYAAARAKEKNPRQGEMINAVIAEPSNQEVLLRQINFLSDLS